jgi:hypothetical protein
VKELTDNDNKQGEPTQRRLLDNYIINSSLKTLNYLFLTIIKRQDAANLLEFHSANSVSLLQSYTRGKI